MPRIGSEPERRRALINSAVEMIGEHGSLDVSVKQIATHAGMSSALAFHYFGDKDGIIIETMRHLLREFSNATRQALANAQTPNERLRAIVNASFSEEQFGRTTVSAWLVFYQKSYSSLPAARLLDIYTARLHSNLVHALKLVQPTCGAETIAAGLAAMIDGIYIRHALRKAGPDIEEATQLCMHYLSASLNVSQLEHDPS